MEGELLSETLGIRRTEERLRFFESKYQLFTAEFINQYENDEHPETLDFDEWIGEARMLQRLQRLQNRVNSNHS
jgi:hypothetical protein